MKISKTSASRFLLTIIILLLVVGVALAVYTFSSNPVQDALSGNRVINVLYVIENEQKPVSAYVLMYYPGTRRAAIFDIPGEIGIIIQGLNLRDRIDRVYDSARIGPYQSEIEKLLGIEINFSVVITKEKLVSIVDFLEGIEIFIPSSVFFRDGDELILFPSGMTVLDGDKASVYAVYNLPYEDRETEVFRRRQRFFIGLLNRQIQMNDILKNPDAAKMYYSFFKTDMNRRTLLHLFNEFVRIDTDRTNIQLVSGTQREVSGQMLTIPLFEGSLVKDVVRQTLAALTREMETRALSIEVLNGTAINGFAGRTAETLRSFGYDVISTGNADRNNYEQTLIIHRSADENLVQVFADLIYCNNIRREFISPEDEEAGQIYEFKADITLIIGRNFNGRRVTGN